MDYDTAIVVSAHLTAVGVLLSSAEMLAGRGANVWSHQPRFVGLPIDPPVPRAIALGRLGGAAVVLLSPSRPSLLAGCVMVAATSLALGALCPFGAGAADQMTTISYVAFTAGVAVTRWAAATCWFLTISLVVVYVTAALVKVTSPAWGRGESLACVLGSNVFGHPALYRLSMDRPRARAAAEVGVVVVQLAFAAALSGPSTPVLYAILAAGVVFHIVNAVALGLYDFAWAFVGLYPILLAI